MALPLLTPLLKATTTLLIRGKAKKIAQQKLRESGKTGIEAAREYGKLTNQRFKQFGQDPITKQAIAKYYKPTITGFDKGFLTGTGLTAITLSGNKSTNQKPISKKEKSLMRYKDRMKKTHDKYGIR